VEEEAKKPELSKQEASGWKNAKKQEVTTANEESSGSEGIYFIDRGDSVDLVDSRSKYHPQVEGSQQIIDCLNLQYSI
jgi:hypothetical protein